MIYRLYVPMQGAFQMDEPDYEIEEGVELLAPPQEEYIPGFVSLSEGELAEYEYDVKEFLQHFQRGYNPLDSCGLFINFEGYDDLRKKMERVDVTAVAKKGCLQGLITVETSESLTDHERYLLERHIRRQFGTGWGMSFPQIDVPGGRLKFCMEEHDYMLFQIQKKYKITDISHPKYPWLHRICSLATVNEHVPAGTLGGYIQREDNLSQEGECWIYDNAICCEGAVVEKGAGLFDGTMARESALITGDACLYDRAVAEGHCYIRNGEIKEEARIAGDAVINESVIDGLSPLIAGRCSVYGEVRGLFVIKDNILPGETLVNPTEDLFILENGKRDVLVKEKKLECPENLQVPKKQKYSKSKGDCR